MADILAEYGLSGLFYDGAAPPPDEPSPASPSLTGGWRQQPTAAPRRGGLSLSSDDEDDADFGGGGGGTAAYLVQQRAAQAASSTAPSAAAAPAFVSPGQVMQRQPQQRGQLHQQQRHQPPQQQEPRAQQPPERPRGPLLSVRASVPERYANVFPYDQFNAVQSECFEQIYGSDDNAVVTAPTGSGKTVLLELAICRLLENAAPGQRIRVVYFAPVKALCDEMVHNFNRKFGEIITPNTPGGQVCCKLTGDTEYAEEAEAWRAPIVCTTPEKWDAKTRTPHALNFAGDATLVLIDEVTADC